MCGDSHTSTHGAFGALAFGIGTSEVEHVLATQCLAQAKPKAMRVNFTGTLSHGVTAKDVALALMGRLGVSGGSGHALELAGSLIDGLSMEQRMTICNMSIEAGARSALDRARCHDDRVPRRPSACAEGRRVDRRGRALAGTEERSGSARSTPRSRST